MQYSEYLAQIAALIKKDPSITVREIADELQFADSKSVYYWLEKGKVGGINDFKRQVLSEDSPFPGIFAGHIGGVAHYLIPIPLSGWNPKEKSPAEEWYYLHNHPEPQGIFAVRVGTNQYSPWFIQNDILVISKASTYSEVEWMLFKSQHEFIIGKNINGQIVEPNTLQIYPSNLITVGTIINQQRGFLP